MRHAHLLVVEGRHAGHELSLRSSDAEGRRKGHAGEAIRDAGFKAGDRVVAISVEEAEKLGIARSS